MNRHIIQIAERQEGLITLNQLTHAVPARHRRRRLIEAGTLIRVAPKTYRIGGAPATHRQQLRAGLLSLGHESWVSFEAAAQLHGFDRSDPDAVEFTVPRGSFVSGSPFCVHTTNQIPLIDRVDVDGIRCTSATRTILDLALARRPEERIEAAIDSAVRKGLSAPHAIARRLETLRGRGRWGCRLIENLVLDSGIHRKGDRHVARVDFLFASQRVVVEVSGQHGHSSPTERRRDAQRRNELQDLGRRVFEYTYADVMRSPDMVIRTLEQRLRDEIG
jgi:very-short-patch-repair endonuclease